MEGIHPCIKREYPIPIFIYEYGVATVGMGSLDNARTPYKTTEQIAFQSPIRNHPAVNPTQLRVRKPYHLWGLVPRYGKVSHYLV